MTKNQHFRKYSPALHAQIVENIRKGQPKRIAFSVARVHPQTVFDWITQGKRFPETTPSTSSSRKTSSRRRTRRLQIVSR